MSVQNTRQKGRRFVKEIIDIFRREIDEATYEVVGSGAGPDKGDVRVPKLDLVIEAKDHKKISVAQWIEQAEEEGLGFSDYALIWKHPRNKEFYVDIPLNYFIELLKKYEEPKIKEPDRELKWKLNHLKTSINQVLKEIKD